MMSGRGHVSSCKGLVGRPNPQEFATKIVNRSQQQLALHRLHYSIQKPSHKDDSLSVGIDLWIGFLAFEVAVVLLVDVVLADKCLSCHDLCPLL